MDELGEDMLSLAAQVTINLDGQDEDEEQESSGQRQQRNERGGEEGIGFGQSVHSDRGSWGDGSVRDLQNILIISRSRQVEQQEWDEKMDRICGSKVPDLVPECATAATSSDEVPTENEQPEEQRAASNDCKGDRHRESDSSRRDCDKRWRGSVQDSIAFN